VGRGLGINLAGLIAIPGVVHRLGGHDRLVHRSIHIHLGQAEAGRVEGDQPRGQVGRVGLLQDEWRGQEEAVGSGRQMDVGRLQFR